jgi:hypothetical protein
LKYITGRRPLIAKEVLPVCYVRAERRLLLVAAIAFVGGENTNQ